MERRELLAVSTAVLALAPLRSLQAQSKTPGSSPPPATPAPAPAATSTSAAPAAPLFTAVQLDQLLAPIALYPDGLLAQTTMAATYPLEVVEAARWLQDNPSLKGDAAVAAAKDKGWDVSVTSLVAFPQVLAMMNSKLDWTQKLGDAMLAQQSDVAASIQRLRAQAQTAGNLKTTPQQKVTAQAPSADAPAGTPQAIVIEPADPNTVYVPAYNPSYVYGAWPYPDYPPTYFPPPAYYGPGPGWAGGLLFGLGIGVGFGFFGGWRWGGGWGGGWGWRGWGAWHGGNTYVTVNNNVTHINNNYFHDHPNHDGHWNHDPAHRHGVPYRDAGSRERYGQHHPTAGEREAFRGRIDHSPHGDEDHRDGNRGNENRGEDHRGEDHRGYENRGRAFSGADHGRQVNHEADRGRSYNRAGHTNYHRTSFHGGGRGGWHGGGHGGRR